MTRSTIKCELCQRPSKHSYERSERTLALCDQCFDRYVVQDAYEQRLPELDRLVKVSDYDAVLDMLQGLLVTHRGRDHDGWLTSSILSHRALVFAEQGRLDEALDEYRERARKPFTDSSEFLINQLAIANVLMRMEEPDLALAELERGLDAANGPSVPTALTLLVRYAAIAQPRERAVPLRYRPLFDRTVDFWGLSLPDSLLSQAESSFAQAIAVADQAIRDAGARFDSLQQQLRNEKPDSPAANQFIQHYAERESVGFFRKMALGKIG